MLGGGLIYDRTALYERTVLADRTVRAEAVPLFEALVAEMESTRGSEHPALAHAKCGLAVARAAASREVDLAAVEQQLARACEWGLAQAVVLRRTSELIE
jgi:hypothetical protein